MSERPLARAMLSVAENLPATMHVLVVQSAEQPPPPRLGEAFVTDEVANKQYARRRLLRGGIDAILLCADSEHGTGLELLLALLKIAPSIPVVVFSRSDSREDGAAFLAAGAQEMLRSVELAPQTVECALEHSVIRHRLREESRKRRIRAEANVVALFRTNAEESFVRRVATTVDHEAQTSIARLGRELEHAHDQRHDFASRAAHDLLSPLGEFGGYLNALTELPEETVGPAARSLCAKMAVHCGHMQTLVRSLLDYARDGKQAVRETVDLNVVMRHVEFLLQQTLREAGATVTSGKLPHVEGDKLALCRLFQNVIENAIKYRGARPLEIKISATRASGHSLLHIADNGIGIPAAQRTRIFEPLVRLDATGDRPGVGLGLASCRTIARQHDGELTAEDTPGGGATFVLTLANATW